MLEGLLKKIFGDPNEKELKEIGVIVDKINALEKDMVGLSSQIWPLRQLILKYGYLKVKH